MGNLVMILGDQLSFEISSLENFDKKTDQILMCEVYDEASYVKHHQKKLILIFSAMRSFAKNLQQKNYQVNYLKLDDKKNTQSFSGELIRICDQLKPKKIIITQPSEYRVLMMFDQLKTKYQLDIEIRSDHRFIASTSEFANFVKNKKQLLMENFYRNMRKKTGLLMEKNNGKPTTKPLNGKWNFDHENRQAMPSMVKIKPLIKFTHDQILLEVIELVKNKFNKNFGNTDNFIYAINHHQAQIQFQDFIDHRLVNFGKYQDAMRDDLEFGFHSIISAYLNIGLLDPLDCCKKVEEAYHQGKCDIASAEGFIRQIIGWREYIRGIYWYFMPKYRELNYFNAKKDLPEFYWQSNKTQMNCLKNVIAQTHDNGYSHHIQRLMITGNFALLSAIDPKQINDWYLAVYVDAFEWVELPNTSGMAIYADGGIVASKPYCASANYINKMSNFCKNCDYDHKKTIGKNACPFNFLYWNFLITNQELLKKNPRLFYPYNNLAKKSKDDIKQIQSQSQEFLAGI